MEIQGISIDYKTIKRFFTIAYIISFTLAISNAIVSILDYASVLSIDIISGPALESRVENEQLKNFLRIFGLIVTPMTNFFVSLCLILLTCTCYTLKTLFLDFNKHLKTEIAFIKPQSQQTLKEMRLMHRRLKGLI